MGLPRSMSDSLEGIVAFDMPNGRTYIGKLDTSAKTTPHDRQQYLCDAIVTTTRTHLDTAEAIKMLNKIIDPAQIYREVYSMALSKKASLGKILINPDAAVARWALGEHHD